jgi:hypothetical protein
LRVIFFGDKNRVAVFITQILNYLSYLIRKNRVTRTPSLKSTTSGQASKVHAPGPTRLKEAAAAAGVHAPAIKFLEQPVLVNMTFDVYRRLKKGLNDV